MKRNKKNSDFFSKKRSKYKLTFFNESSLEDVWTICFSRFGAIMTAILHWFDCRSYTLCNRRYTCKKFITRIFENRRTNRNG